MTTTHPMIERLQDAVHKCFREDGFVDTKLIVFAVLRTLRDPDEGMVEAANTAYEPDWEYGITDDDMAKALAAAIDSILTEQKEQP